MIFSVNPLLLDPLFLGADESLLAAVDARRRSGLRAAAFIIGEGEDATLDDDIPFVVVVVVKALVGVMATANKTQTLDKRDMVVEDAVMITECQ